MLEALVAIDNCGLLCSELHHLGWSFSRRFMSNHNSRNSQDNSLTDTYGNCTINLLGTTLGMLHFTAITFCEETSYSTYLECVITYTTYLLFV